MVVLLAVHQREIEEWVNEWLLIRSNWHVCHCLIGYSDNAPLLPAAVSAPVVMSDMMMISWEGGSRDRGEGSGSW